MCIIKVKYELKVIQAYCGFVVEHHSKFITSRVTAV